MQPKYILLSMAVLGFSTAMASAQPFVMQGTTYQVDDIAGTGSNRAVLELDFGTNAAPQAHLFGYEWNSATPTPPTTPNGRDVLSALQADNQGLTFTDTFFASFGEYLLNTLWYKTNQPANDYPNSFWLYFSSENGQAFSETNTGYDQTPVLDGTFYGWALQTSDPNEFTFNPPFAPPSHFPAAINGTAAPEPGTLALAGLAMVSLCARRRR